ncbi:hypothetical protein [Caulobacter sp. 3R27C2-B]|uniref:hypothetical protein n=1 Tax=Caulobacter sp. 3R27C2-B TaxID=2502219 RepID=UPI0010FA5753|nr:hypothetical protein [Caulobacter sp. 3R27C2-B]
MSYYTENPPIVATVFNATGRAYMVIGAPQSDIAAMLQPADLGWMRGEAMWVGDGDPNILTAGAYAVDPATREITLS